MSSPGTRADRGRVLMVALDAAELSFVRASLPRLPVLRRLFDEAVFFPLRSSAEYVSASVWPTMYTGGSVGEHGISQHIQWDPAAMRMRRISADWLYCEPFWYTLARAGLGVTVLDVPFAFENRLPQAVEVTNWGSHDLLGRLATNPPGLRREIIRQFGHHPMGYEIPVSKDTRQLTAMQRELVEGAAIKGRLARWLRDTTDWDFYLAVFGETHRGGHILWRDHDTVHAHVPPGALLDVYRSVDAGLGAVLEGVDTETTTVIVSALHGMGANVSQEHFVRRAMDRINAGFRHETAARERPPAAQRGLMRTLRESIPAPVQHAVARAVPVEVRDWVVSREVTGGLDWQRTPGFALRSDLFSFVRLNVAGRERQGLLEPGSERVHPLRRARHAELPRAARRRHGRAHRPRRRPCARALLGSAARAPTRSHPALDARVSSESGVLGGAWDDRGGAGLGTHRRAPARWIRARSRKARARGRPTAAHQQRRLSALRLAPSGGAPGVVIGGGGDDGGIFRLRCGSLGAIFEKTDFVVIRRRAVDGVPAVADAVDELHRHRLRERERGHVQVPALTLQRDPRLPVEALFQQQLADAVGCELPVTILEAARGLGPARAAATDLTRRHVFGRDQGERRVVDAQLVLRGRRRIAEGDLRRG